MTTTATTRQSPSLGGAPLDGLDDEQVGHLRHIDNLVSQLDGEWSKMGAAADPWQEGPSAYRYQLSNMAYALALAHYHRLPAAPEVFRGTYQRLIHKMLLPDVWNFWGDMSKGGVTTHPDMTELRRNSSDPVGDENIMYSGHLLAMVAMYAMLFDDDRYAEEGALTFRHHTIYWGLGPEDFVYDADSLNELIYWQMVENGYMGVACEPDCIFMYCNQLPIHGFRFQDARRGTQVADEVTAGFVDAWQRKGMFAANGHLNFAWIRDRDVLLPGMAGTDLAVSSMMNAWNREFARSKVEELRRECFRQLPDGRMATKSMRLPADIPASALGIVTTPIGNGAKWASELGQADILDGLLSYADELLSPRWDDGGYYYPRNDRPYDDDGNDTLMDPNTGNALLALARLNVPDGIHDMYQAPWTAEQHAAPQLGTIDGDVDVLAARYVADDTALAFTVRGRDSVSADVGVDVRNPTRRPWTLSVDGVDVARGDATTAAPAPGGDAGARVEWRDDVLRIERTVDEPATFVVTWG